MADEEKPAAAANADRTLGSLMKASQEPLRVKSAEAVAGGATHEAVGKAARWLQTNAPGGVRHFAAFNDRFHQSFRPNSLHTRGLAGDATFNDPSQYAAGKRALAAHFRAAGLGDDEVQLIDHHARGDAPPHLHFGFRSKESADRYAAHVGGPAEPLVAGKSPSGGGKGRADVAHGATFTGAAVSFVSGGNEEVEIDTSTIRSPVARAISALRQAIDLVTDAADAAPRAGGFQRTSFIDT